jgi:hypothetical protein
MISRFWRCFILERQKMREEPEIKLSNKLAELKRLNQPPTERVGKRSLQLDRCRFAGVLSAAKENSFRFDL